MENEIKGEIVEVFPSIQGEGIFVGQPQLFIRFAGCNLECDYCDTDFHNGTYLTKEELINQICRIQQTKDRLNHKLLDHSVSLTGGEPLLQVDFLRGLIPKIKQLGLKIYLETNGTLPKNLSKIIDLVDYVSMDIKLPSACRRSYWREHTEFLQLMDVHKRDSCFVKVVLTNKTKQTEIEKVIKLLDRGGDVPLVLQPVTPIRGVKPPKKEKIFLWQQQALKYLKDVRVIPQVHKLLKIK